MITYHRLNWRLSFIVLSAGALTGQDLDTVVLPDQRKPFTFLDQLADKEERKSFLAIYAARPPAMRLERAEEFLHRYPQSWLLSYAHEIAAKASIDLGMAEKAVTHADRSLRLLPENPLLLTPLARLYLEQQRFADAVRGMGNGLPIRAERRTARPDSSSWLYSG